MMYADHRYQPPKSRTAGLGGALAISALFAAGATLLAPSFMPKEKITTLTGTNISIEIPPEPVIEEPVLKKDPIVQSLPIYVPDSLVKTPATAEITMTKDVPTEPPPTFVGETGPVAVNEALKPPPPPLVLATTDPRFARDFQPDYPPTELRAGRDGKVSVRVLIGADGRVKAVEQVSATSAAFFEATRRQALAKWRFKPASRGGAPEESWKQMSVRFNIEDQ